jgi:hypothetical protein
MTQRRVRAAACGLAVLLTSVAVGLSPRRAIVTPQETPFPTAPARVDLGVALPPGFSATVDLTRKGPLARVVVSDIDRDGDIDVVASVGTLDLIVWTNDGAGHFSAAGRRPHRRASVRHHEHVTRFVDLPEAVLVDRRDAANCENGRAAEGFERSDVFPASAR